MSSEDATADVPGESGPGPEVPDVAFDEGRGVIEAAGAHLTFFDGELRLRVPPGSVEGPVEQPEVEVRGGGVFISADLPALGTVVIGPRRGGRPRRRPFESEPSGVGPGGPYRPLTSPTVYRWRR